MSTTSKVFAVAGELASRRDRALDLIKRYGDTGSISNKQWIIDQILRALTGSAPVGGESHEYHQAIREAGYNILDWDRGEKPR